MATQAQRIDALEGQLSTLTALLTQLVDGSTQDDAPAKPERTRKPSTQKGTPNGAGRESTFPAGACKRLDIPRKKGSTFTYHGRRGATQWVVTAVLDNGGIQARRTK